MTPAPDSDQSPVNRARFDQQSADQQQNSDSGPFRKSIFHDSGFRWWHEVAVFVLLVLVLMVAQELVPGFLNPRSQLLLSRHVWEMALISLGMMLIIITAGIDLSVGSTMGLCAVAFGVSFEMTSSILLSCLFCVLTGFGCGALNGALISRWRLHPLIVTLATYAAYRGIAEGWSQGHSWSGFGASFSQLSRGRLLGIPYPGLTFFALTVIAAIVLWKTPAGKHLSAMGYNEKAARFSGIRVDLNRFLLFCISGTLSGLAAVFYVARFDTAKADAGEGFELDAITAVVAGGTSIFGGRGNVIGTILGLLLIHETRQFVGRYWGIEELKSIFVGGLLISFVLIYQFLRPSGQRV
ncbi:MAG: ABC transporter permease [Planctomyces sp.]|nr:ABC transporter permease [Planctomyces sp.]